MSSLKSRTRGRRPRQHVRRAVSPVIATILLVMITVILTAVLYEMTLGLAHGENDTPLGSTFGFGTVAIVGSGAPTAGCPAGGVCYALDIATAGDGLAGRSLEFAARSPAGATVGLAGWTFTLLAANGSAMSATWIGAGTCTGAACATPLVGGDTLDLNTGGAGNLAYDQIVGAGLGAFAGDVFTVALPT